MDDNEINCYYASIPVNSEGRETRLLTVEPGEWHEDIHCSLRTISLPDYGDVLKHDTADVYLQSTWPHSATDSIAQIAEDVKQHSDRHDNFRDAWQNLEAPMHAFEMPVFEALSYVWGSPSIATKIHIRGLGALPITSNLHDALRRLRRRDDEQFLWIDAFCVNQNDPVERASQVLLMKQIYSTAHRVIIWLGEPQNHSSLAQCDVPALEAPRVNPLAEASDAYDSSLLARKTSLDKVLDKADRVWWTRMWVLQELVNSRREPRVVYGTIFMPWGDFLRVAFCEHGISQHSKAFTNEHSSSSILRMMASLRNDHRRLADTVSSLLVLSIATEQLTATDERDKLYALFGLLREQHAVPFKVDYTISPGRAFTEATIVLINTLGNLSPLMFVRPNRRPRPDLASWAIDFAAATVPIRSGVSTDNTMNDFMSMLDLPVVAGRSRRVNAVAPRIITGHSPTLQISATLIDTVTAIATFGKIDEESQLLSLLNSLPSTVTQPWEEVMSGDPIMSEGTLWPRLRTALDDLAARSSTAKRGTHYYEMETLLVAWSKDFHVRQQFLERRHRWRLFAQLLKFRGASPALFTTKLGYMGCSSDPVRVDDAIVCAERSNTPLLLRPSDADASYTFQGVVYIPITFYTTESCYQEDTFSIR
ncbi:hypothetical protein LTR17_001076 [Elasticomyces elasticus]|nr:hypothetical protein LTR17_001076 [Elasticomyces elasticus]